MNTNEQVHGSNEISLYDLLGVIIRRKVLVISILMLFVLPTVIYVMSKTPVYKVTAIASVGSVQYLSYTGVSDAYVEKPADTAVSLNGTNDVDVTTDGGNLFFAKMSTNPPEAVEAIEKIINSLLPKHELLYNKLLSQIKKNVKEMENEFKAIDQQQKQIQKVKAKANQQAIVMALTEERNLQSRKVELLKELFRAKMLEENSKPTTILQKASIPATSYAPKKKRNISLAIVFGLFFGVSAVFILEYFYYVKARRQAS